MFWLWALAGAAAIIAIAALSQITFDVRCSKINKDEDITVRVRALFGLVRIRYEVPMIKLRGLLKGLILETELDLPGSDDVIEGKINITKDRIIRYFKTRKQLLAHVVGYSSWMRQTLAHVRVTKLRWDTRIGTGEAARTAVATGFLWSITSSFIAFLSRYIRMETTPQISIQPQYIYTEFALQVDTQARITLGYAAFAGFKLLYRIMRTKNGLRTWIRLLLSNKQTTA